jgi:hypothetical protein
MYTNPTFPNDLDRHTCTEKYHRFGLSRKVVCTDGVKHLADSAHAFWLLNIISSYQFTPKVATCGYIQFWTLENKGNKKAVVYCQSDDGMPKNVEQVIEHTDFPFTSANHKVKIWATVNDDMIVLLLPSEY